MLKKLFTLCYSLGFALSSFANCDNNQSSYELHVANMTSQNIVLSVLWDQGDAKSPYPANTVIAPNSNGEINMCMVGHSSHLLVGVGPYRIYFLHYTTDDQSLNSLFQPIQLQGVRGQFSSAKYFTFLLGPSGGTYSFYPDQNYGSDDTVPSDASAFSGSKYMWNCTSNDNGNCRVAAYFIIRSLPAPDQPE